MLTKIECNYIPTVQDLLMKFLVLSSFAISLEQTTAIHIYYLTPTRLLKTLYVYWIHPEPR